MNLITRYLVLIGPLLATAPATALAQASLADTGAVRGSDERGVLRLGTAEGAQLTLGGYVQVDGRWVSGSASLQPDGVLLRRARLVFDAALPNGWHLRLQPDFGQGRVLVQDAFAGRDGARVQLRAGRFRPAFGTERMQSSSTLLAPERGIANSLMPSRSFGVQATWMPGAWRIAMGGFRTPIGTDVAPVDTDGDVDAVPGSGHDFLLRAARVFHWGGGFAEVQGSVLTGRERGTTEAAALSRVLSVAQQPILRFRDDGTDVGTVRASGARTRGSLGAVVSGRQLLVGSEVAWLQQRVTRGATATTPTIGAAVIRSSRIWNGVRTRAQEVVPRSPRGALEIGLRAGVIGAWGDSLPSLIARTSTTHATTGGVAISWLPTTLTRVTMAYDVTQRRGGTAPSEHALLARWQQGF